MTAYISDSTGDTYCEKHCPNDGYKAEVVELGDRCAICRIYLAEEPVLEEETF